MSTAVDAVKSKRNSPKVRRLRDVSYEPIIHEKLSPVLDEHRKPSLVYPISPEISPDTSPLRPNIIIVNPTPPSPAEKPKFTRKH